MLTDLIGRCCNSVEKHEFSWSFGFGENCGLSLECPWRIVADRKIVVAIGDDGQQYGLPEPIDVSQIGAKLLAGKVVEANATRAGDLTIIFDNGIRLESFNDSSGYEAWVLSTSEGIVVGRNE